MLSTTRSKKTKQKRPRNPKNIDPAIEALGVAPEVKQVLRAIQREVTEVWSERVTLLVQMLELHGAHLENCNVYYSFKKNPTCTCGLQRVLDVWKS